MAIVKDLGWCFARGDVVKGTLLIVSPCCNDERFHQPAATIEIYRRQDIEALRDFCAEILDHKAESSPIQK